MIENFMWMPCPYVRYAFCQISGILAASYAGPQAWFEVMFVTTTTLFAIVFVLRKRLGTSFRNIFFGCLGFTITFGLGALRFTQNDQSNNPEHLLQNKDSISHYTATVVSDVTGLKNYWKTLVFIDSVKTKKGWTRCEARAFVYIKKDAGEVATSYGDRLLVKGAPAQVRPPSNPAAFDYRNYLALQNIFHQHFTESGDVVRYGHVKSNMIYQSAFKAKKAAINIIEGAIGHQRERSIVMSLLIGERGMLDKEVKQVYSEVGAMHVLAVSGLHVGIVYLLFSTSMGFLKKNKRLKWLFLVICLLALWFYALLTGLSTSVLRAVVMFSIILLGDTLGRRSNIFNNIALAAFLLLLFDPNYLFQVGFQLSFAAVTGIVYLQPKIAGWFHFSHVIPDKIWQLTAVSIAAQLATFPISVYYFHQFPAYFWLTNLLVIPSATVTIVSGVLVLLLGAFDMSVAFLSNLLEKVVFFTNEGLVLIRALPWSNIGDLYFTGWDTILVYAVMIALTRFLCTSRLHYLTLGVVLTLFFSTGLVFRYIDTLRQCQVVFYDIRKVCAIDFIKGRQQDLLVTAKKQVAPQNLKATIANYRLSRGLTTNDLNDPKQILIDTGDNVSRPFYFFSWNNLVFLSLNGKVNLYRQPAKKIKVNYLLVNNQAIREFDQITANFTFDRLIITNLNTFRYASDLYNYCVGHQISVYSVAHSGALIRHLNEE